MTSVTTTISVSIAFASFVTLKFFKTKRKILQFDEYILLLQQPVTENAKQQRINADLMDDDHLFVASPLNSKYLKTMSIKYSNKAFASILGICNIDIFVLQMLSNYDSLQPVASFYSGSTPQPKGMCAFVGTMGDGRVCSIGNLKDRFGKKWEVQLKGFGKSVICEKHKDGKMSLSEYEKEYLCWSKLKGFGIPTYEILAAVVLNGSVRRKKKSKSPMIGLIRCCRGSWFRIGHFEYLYYAKRENKKTMLLIINAMNEKYKNNDFELAIAENVSLDKLQNWMKERVFLKESDIEIDEGNNGENDEKVLFFLKCVFERNAFMISKWMFHGFVHGMMRSDNIHIDGISFDLGSGTFIDMDNESAFNPSYQSGKVRMYSFENQVECIAILLKRLAICCLFLVKDFEKIQNELYKFWINFWYFLLRQMQEKYGDKGMDLMDFQRNMKPNTFSEGHRWLIQKYQLK